MSSIKVILSVLRVKNIDLALGSPLDPSEGNPGTQGALRTALGGQLKSKLNQKYY